MRLYLSIFFLLAFIYNSNSTTKKGLFELKLFKQSISGVKKTIIYPKRIIGLSHGIKLNIEVTSKITKVRQAFDIHKELKDSISEFISGENKTNENHVSYEGYDLLLKRFVTKLGNVDYTGFANEQTKLEEYLQELGKLHPEKSWSKSEQLTYWINLYNASTINLVLENYPVTSIKDISKGNPWDLPIVTSGDSIYSLNQIENEIIRPSFSDPRIHFVLNCAARSCPKLLNTSYKPNKLDTQLHHQTKIFINSSSNKISKDNVELSKIFDWYKADFELNGSLINFLNKYSNTYIDADANIIFKEYNWELNK